MDVADYTHFYIQVSIEIYIYFIRKGIFKTVN